jgi:hypothetical protein
MELRSGQLQWTHTLNITKNTNIKNTLHEAALWPMVDRHTVDDNHSDLMALWPLHKMHNAIHGNNNNTNYDNKDDLLIQITITTIIIIIKNNDDNNSNNNNNNNINKNNMLSVQGPGVCRHHLLNLLHPLLSTFPQMPPN